MDLINLYRNFLLNLGLGVSQSNLCVVTCKVLKACQINLSANRIHDWLVPNHKLCKELLYKYSGHRSVCCAVTAIILRWSCFVKQNCITIFNFNCIYVTISSVSLIIRSDSWNCFLLCPNLQIMNCTIFHAEDLQRKLMLFDTTPEVITVVIGTLRKVCLNFCLFLLFLYEITKIFDCFIG